MWVCVSVHGGGHSCMCVHVHVEARGWCQLSASITHHLPLRNRASDSIWNSPILLGWLANELEGSLVSSSS